MNRQIALVDMDSFFASVERVLDPGLEGAPLIVGGDREARGAVACASYEARACGVKSGMALRQAARLCPQAVFLRGTARAYVRAQKAVIGIIGDYTSEVEPFSIDESYMDLTGSQLMFGPAPGIIAAIQGRIRDELRLPCSIGLGTNALVAKVASRKAKPAGVCVVPEGKEAEFMAPLWVQEIPGVGAHTQASLLGMGIKTVGDMVLVGPEALKKRFGVIGLDLYAKALGRGETELHPLYQPEEPRKSMSHSVTFPRDLMEPERIFPVLLEIAADLGRMLREESRLARKVTLTLRFSDFYTITRSITLREPTAMDVVLYHTAARLFEEHRTQRPLPIRLVGIQAAGLIADQGQLPLFDTGNFIRNRDLYRTMDAINQKFGPGAALMGRAEKTPASSPNGDLFPNTLARKLHPFAA